MAPKRKPLSEKVKSSLKKKAEGTKFKYGELAAVYRKGQGAYLSSGSRNVPMAAWSMGRVNSYSFRTSRKYYTRWFHINNFFKRI